jgi:hypothetical protein
MADNDPLGLNPAPEQVVPKPIDPEAWEASHQKALSAYNELDPTSIVFGRKDLADAARAKLQLQYDALKLRAGVVYVPETAATLAEKDEAAKWGFSEMSPEYWAEVDQRIAGVKALSPAERDAAVAVMVERFGTTEWQHQVDMGRPPTMDRRAFIQAEGARQYEALVEQAKAARPNLDPAALQDLYLLRTLAGYGKYKTAEAQHRVKFTKAPG